MSWTVFHTLIRKLSTPIRRFISIYVILVGIFTIFRIFGIRDLWWIDLANAFAPLWFIPMIVTFPLSVVVTRQSDKKHPPRWSVTLQVLLMAIGLYWFALPTIYKPVPPPTTDTFKVVTYNILGENRDVSEAIDWLVATNADIIVLQETSQGYDKRLVELYDVYAHESHIEGSVRIFSRYEIVTQEILVIEDNPGHLVLRVVLNQNGNRLAVYATHFVLPQQYKPHLAIPAKSYPITFALRYDETRRNNQIRNLLYHLRIAEPYPHIVAGDFNMSDWSLMYREIDAQLDDAFREVGAGAGRTWPVAEKINLPRIIQPVIRIDYIWYTDDLRAVTSHVGTEIGSDHLPVTAEFEWVTAE